MCAVGEPKPTHGIPESASAVGGIPPACAPGTLPPTGGRKGGEDAAGGCGKTQQRASFYTTREEVCCTCRATRRYGQL